MVVAAVAFVDVDLAGLDPGQRLQFGNYRPQIYRLRGWRTNDLQPWRRRISFASCPFADPATPCSSKKPPAHAGVYRNTTRPVSVPVFFQACGTPRGRNAQVPDLRR